MSTAEAGFSTSVLVKYFLHGLAFSVLFIVLALIWAIITAVLLVVGLFIGFIIGIIILFYFIGGLNAGLTSLIWSLQVKTNFLSLLSHGFVLFIILLLAGIPQFILLLGWPSLIMSVILSVVYAFADGFIAKTVASRWEFTAEEYEYEAESETV
jgi:hypothetical protein